MHWKERTALDNSLIQNAFKLSLKNKRCYFFLLCSVVDPDPDHFGNLDPHPHQLKISIRIPIRIKVVSRIRIRIKVMLDPQHCFCVRTWWSHYFIGKAKAWIWVGRPQPYSGMSTVYVAGINYLDELILDDLHVVRRWFAVGRRGRGRGRRYLQHLPWEHQPGHPCISSTVQ